MTSDWQAVTERTQLVEDYNTTGGFLPPGTAIDGGRRLATAPGSLGGALGATRRPTLLGSMTVRGEGMLLTTEGLRTTGRTEEEAAFNASLTGSRPATSISQQRQFADFATGQGIVSQQRSGNAAAAMIATFDEEAKAVEALTGTDKFLPRKSPIKAWSATLPQTPTTLTRSSLNDLRNNVQSHKSVGTMHTSPFTTIRRDFRPLSPDQMDLKKVRPSVFDFIDEISAPAVAWKPANCIDASFHHHTSLRPLLLCASPALVQTRNACFDFIDNAPLAPC